MDLASFLIIGIGYIFVLVLGFVLFALPAMAVALLFMGAVFGMIKLIVEVARMIHRGVGR